MSNNALLLALDSAGPPAEDGGMPGGVLLGANYSVPVLWLSLFDADGLVAWPGFGGSGFTAVVQPRDDCIRRSRDRVEGWRRRWPEVFGDVSGLWLGYVSAVEAAYLAVWAEEISEMAEDDETWAGALREYLRCLDDPESAGFRKALAQSYLYFRGSRLEADGGDVRLAAAGYAWDGQAPWEEARAGS